MAVRECVRLAKRSSNDFVAVRIIEGNRIDNVPMSFKSKQLITRDSIPHFASSIVAARDELISRFVEGAIC